MGERIENFRITINAVQSDGEKFNLEIPVEASAGAMMEKPESEVKKSKRISARLSSDKLIHRVAAKCRIQELENIENVSKKTENTKSLLDLALKYNLASSQTSFIAIRTKQGEPDVCLRTFLLIH